MPFLAARFEAATKKRLISVSFRALAVLLPSLFLYHAFSDRENLGEMAAVFGRQLENSNIWWLTLALLLAPINWLTEVEKWRPFLVSYESISRGRALRAVLAGTSLALFTPNRLGEYGGRVLFVQPENRWKALFANALGSTSQYLVLLTGGMLGGLWFAGQVLGWEFGLRVALFVLSALLLAILFYIYFNVRLLVPFVRRIPLLSQLESYRQDVDFLGTIGRSKLSVLLFWSALRYTVYSSQYVLLLYFLGIKPGLTASFAGVATIFLLQTIAPLPALAGLIVRGSLAVFTWSYFGANELASLSVSFLLWIINLILPALIGTFFLFSVNITKSLGYEDD